MLRRNLALVSMLVMTACADQLASPDVPSATFSAAAGPVIHQVSAGGPDLCSAFGERPGCFANFSLTARQYANGEVTGELQDASLIPGDGVHATIDCLAVQPFSNATGSGLEAWIGGVIILPADLAGHRIILRARDRGASQQDPPDAISFALPDPENSGISANCQDRPFMTLFRISQGQVTVR